MMWSYRKWERLEVRDKSTDWTPLFWRYFLDTEVELELCEISYNSLWSQNRRNPGKTLKLNKI